MVQPVIVFAGHVALLGDPLEELLGGYETHLEGGDLGGSDELAGPLKALDLLLAREHRVRGAGIRPIDRVGHPDGAEALLLEVQAVDVRYLELAPLGRLDHLGERGRLPVVVVQSRHGHVGFRILRLLLDLDYVAVPVELRDPEVLRVADAGTEHRCTVVSDAFGDEVGHLGTVEHIVAEGEYDVVVLDEALRDYQGVGNALPALLGGVPEGDPELFPLPEELLELGAFGPLCDDQDFLDAYADQSGQRIVDRRFVVYLQQGLRNRMAGGIHARPLSRSENYTLHQRPIGHSYYNICESSQVVYCIRRLSNNRAVWNDTSHRRPHRTLRARDPSAVHGTLGPCGTPVLRNGFNLYLYRWHSGPVG